MPPQPAADAGAARSDAGTAPPPKKPAADGGNDEDAGSSRPVLCDGSDALRLVYSSSGGFVSPAFGFTNPYGHSFLAVDGKCRYFAEDNYMLGILSGTLTTADAEQLSADLHWNDLDSWASYGLNKDAPCPDSSVISLAKAKASAGCSCGCDPAAPSGLGDALAKAQSWLQKLEAIGKPLDGPVSAVITDASMGKAPRQPELDWPLARAIDAIPNLIVDLADTKLWMGAGPWARFDDAADYTKLRELRRTTVTSDPRGPDFAGQAVLIRDHGKEYDLFVRDELPAETERAWKELQATLPTQ